MFWTRLLSSAVLLALALITMLSGGRILQAATIFLSVLAYFELIKAMEISRIKQKTGQNGTAAEKGNQALAGDVFAKWKKNGLEIVGIWGIILYYILLGVNLETGLMPVQTGMLLCIIAVFMGEMFVYVFAFPKFQAEQVMASFFSFIYGPVCLSFVYLTRELREGLSPENSAPAGLYIVWLILLSSWGCDTCAYCVGKLLGKHKMSPVLSPKKSVEGAIGGVLGSAGLGALYGYFVRGSFADERVVPFFALICAAASLISMVGDLAASAIKRNAGIKDYGNLIPGHGGVMDRFDSVIFTAPVIYFMALLLF